MISIVICSVNPLLFAQIKENISRTIGTQFEVIKIDNTGSQYSICTAYNTGAAAANFPYLCFIHEDIVFRSANWGAELIKFFEKNKEAGLVGVAGSKYKSLAPGPWVNGFPRLDCLNLIQHSEKLSGSERENTNPEGDNLYVEVQTVDGLFLFTTRQVWLEMPFDQQTFDGFHCYDLDFSLQVGRKYKIYVSYALLLEHLSTGSLNKEWIKQSILLSDKWKSILPVGKLTLPEKRAVEWQQKKMFFQKMLIYGSSKSEAARVFFRFGYFKFFSLTGNLKFLGEITISISRKLFK
jgi:GT2 family glycosyltransferase